MTTETFPTYASRCTQDVFGAQTTKLILTAGVIGEIAVEIFAWVVAPALLGRPMEPSVLIQNLADAQFGITLPMWIAFPIHFVTGAYIFVLGYVYFCDATKIKSALLAGSVWGLILWATAQGFFAPLAGRPFFLGFIPYTWASVVLHTVAFTIPMALALEYFGRRWSYEPRSRAMAR